MRLKCQNVNVFTPVINFFSETPKNKVQRSKKCMKSISKMLLFGITSAFWLCCSVGNAQITTLIYSNAFDSGHVNITNTHPDYAVGQFGGSNNAAWLDAGGFGDTNAFYADGFVGTPQRDAVLLPFTAQSNQIYNLSISANFTGFPGSWIGAGYAQHYSMGGINNAFAQGSVNGYGWALMNENNGTLQYFAGPGGGNGIAPGNTFSPVTGIHTLTFVINSTSNLWTLTGFIDGKQMGPTPNYVYTYATIPSILSVGVGQNGFAAGPSSLFQWTSLILSATHLAVVGQPASVTVNQGSTFTDNVVAGGTPPFYYQWFTNGIPILNATNAILTLNSVLPNYASTNYYAVITNVYGAVTSSPATLTVLTSPVFVITNPITYTNPMVLYGGTNNGVTTYLGSTPSFSVSASGLQPITYFWQSNGVSVGGATSTNFIFPNCQLSSPTNFSCIASNSLGTGTNTWLVNYLPAPTAPFPQLVLADNPVAYWRLNEPDDGTGDGNPGAICNDYQSGNNGIYTNTYLSNAGIGGTGYSPSTDPTELSAGFGIFAAPYSDANSIGTNIDFSGSSNATFTVATWANGQGLTQTAAGGLVTKGFFNGEEFTLDEGGTGSALRLSVRNTAGTAINASSSVKLGNDSNWHFVVGVCDEPNTNVTLYVDGHLVATVYVAPNSGLFKGAAATPIILGARSNTKLGDTQFEGSMNDAAVFNQAITADQVIALYQAAGYVVTPYLELLGQSPPTNLVYQANSTVTIPVTAYGTPPYGYYWTNVTAGGIIAGDSTNNEGALNATLTIPNAAASLSGDVLELVLTNVTVSTNWFVTLFSPPPPVTLDYSNSILYSNQFNGGTWNLAGQSATAANSLVGGTNTLWIDAAGTNDPGSMFASGLDNTAIGDSWIFPFTPHAGYVYTLSATVTFYGNPGSWIGLGFAQTVSSNAPVAAARFTDGGAGPLGYDWMLVNGGNGNVEFFAGPGGAVPGTVTNATLFTPAYPGTYPAEVVLDTTGPQWVQYAFINGVSAGTNTYASNPPIGAVGITQNGLTVLNDVQWNNVALTQVAPGGVPPYLLNLLPPTNSIVLTNATITIPATGFGSAVLGYSWINNSTVVASGTTNNMAPLPANLSIASTSLSAGQLELVVTNAYGTNITIIPLIAPYPTNAPPITWGMTNGTLYVSWPANFNQEQLQAQTNSVTKGIGTNWVDLNPSIGTNQVAIPMDRNNGTVFFRLKH
jgi:hypothetical protein